MTQTVATPQWAGNDRRDQGNRNSASKHYEFLYLSLYHTLVFLDGQSRFSNAYMPVVKLPLRSCPSMAAEDARSSRNE